MSVVSSKLLCGKTQSTLQINYTNRDKIEAKNKGENDINYKNFIVIKIASLFS